MPAPTYLLPPYIDSTMLSTFRSCPQKFYIEFCLGLRPESTSIDLHAGAVFSATLERFYREVWLHGADTTVALGRAFTTFSHEWGNFVIRNDRHPKTPENMWAAVESYIAKYPPKSDLCQPYFTDGIPSFEFSFAIPLDFPSFPRHPISGDPFIYTGRFDMFGRWNNLPVVRDEKTAQRLESNWAERWDLRSQFLGYCWALQHNGIPCNTVIVRGIIITLREIRQVEAVKTYSQSLIAKWFEQLRRDLIRLVECHNSAYWDYNLGDSCTSFGRMCQFADLCTSPHPENWYSAFVERRWNPLSRNPISDAPSSIAANYVSSGNIPSQYLHLLPQSPDSVITNSG